MTATSPCLRLLPQLLATLSLAALAACGSGSDGDSGFALQTTSNAATPSAPIVLAGDWLVYFASEGFTGPGTDLNGDADTTDQVAFAVNLRSREETNLGVAAQGAVVVADEIYLSVDETLDGTDWNGGGIGDDVLLHWNETTLTVALVDTLALGFAEELPFAVDGRLYYGAAVAVPGVDESSLRLVDPLAPTTPVVVLNQAGAGAVTASLIGTQVGLLFAEIDETVEALDQNGDGDATDEHVLALLDGTDAAARLISTELALADEDEPIAARVIAAGDWLVAFLVDEASQGAASLNDQNDFSQPLLPENCLAVIDADATDRVLHYLEFADFEAGTAPPVNTGIAGHLRVLALDGFVATISNEADANCNLNAATLDADTNDDVARWVATTLPVAPARSGEDLHALATGIGGGSFGLSVLDNRLIAVIDEAADDEDFDTQAGEAVANHELVAWLDPEAGNPTWDFTHQSGSSRGIGTGVFDDDGDSEPFAATSWMAAEPVGDRLGLVFLEEGPGETNADVGSLNTNLDCALVAKDSDKTDGLPVWADFESGPILDFDGVGYSVDAANAGIEIASGFAFFRVSEAADNRDYNNDSDTADVVLFRNPLTTCGPVPMATSSLVTGPVLTTDRDAGAAFLSSETQAGIDFNGDGDETDLVVRYFRF
jgi:hypothetical protein